MRVVRGIGHCLRLVRDGEVYANFLLHYMEAIIIIIIMMIIIIIITIKKERERERERGVWGGACGQRHKQLSSPSKRWREIYANFLLYYMEEITIIERILIIKLRVRCGVMGIHDTEK